MAGAKALALAATLWPCAGALGPRVDTPLGELAVTDAVRLANEVLSFGRVLMDGAAELRDRRGEKQSAKDLRYVSSKMSTWGLALAVPPLLLDLLLNYGLSNLADARLGHSMGVPFPNSRLHALARHAHPTPRWLPAPRFACCNPCSQALQAHPTCQ